jgi:hypothetical protein
MKLEQLQNMDAVHEGAEVTIMAAAVGDASFGLPGVSSHLYDLETVYSFHRGLNSSICYGHQRRRARIGRIKNAFFPKEDLFPQSIKLISNALLPTTAKQLPHNPMHARGTLYQRRSFHGILPFSCFLT